MLLKTNKKFKRIGLLSIFLFLVLASSVFAFEPYLFNKTKQTSQNETALQNTDSLNFYSKGYHAVITDGDTFIAAGSGGRLDRITLNKKVKKLSVPTNNDLTGICVGKGMTIVTGTGGTILVSKNGIDFIKAKSGLNSTIYGIAFLGKTFVACSEKGIILTSSDGVKWKQVQTQTMNDIISIASNSERVIAITRESDILVTTDLPKWKIQNFNKYYKASYSPKILGKINNSGKTFFISGQSQENPNIPFVMYSDDAEFWTDKTLDQINNKELNPDTCLKINSLCINIDQIVAVCDGGQLLTITNCSACNKITPVSSKNLNDLADCNGKLIVVGDNFTFDLIEDINVRQYKIKAEQAQIDIEKGAYIVDVRTDEEYNTLHILGSLHIPVQQIEEKLIESIPNTEAEIIFYCGTGARSQTALEKALGIGYTHVYNLGGISDWPYDTKSTK